MSAMEQIRAIAEEKPVELNLVGKDGNAFAVLGLWQRAARKAGWTDEERTLVMDEAMSGDYTHLLGVVLETVSEPLENECV